MRKTFLMAGAACIFMALASAGFAQDGNAMIKKMEAAYAGLRSYTQRTSASGTVIIGKSKQMRGMTAELHYQQPNKIFISVTSPQTGTIAAFTDGRDQTVYRSQIRIYSKQAAPPSARGFIVNLAIYQIEAFMDPLFFIEGETAGKYASSFVFRGVSKVNGQSCNLVVGQMKPATLKGAKSGTVSFWLDPATNLIRKVQVERKGMPVRFAVKGTKNGRPATNMVTVPSDQIVSELVQEMQVNPPLNDSAFSYPIPKDSIEQKPAALIRPK
jgi:outer membrane lipoprotein-sorting protein